MCEICIEKTIALRGDKVPEFGNINIENVTTKYAWHALRMQGLSNQPIQGINVKDFFCKSSCHIFYAT